MKNLIIFTINMGFLLAFTNTLAAANPVEQPDGDGWFCEQGKQTKEWVCLQSESIGSSAETRETDPEDSLNPALNLSLDVLEPVKRDVRPLIELIESAEPVVEPAIKPRPTPVPAHSVDPDLPLYVRLSYKPGQAINISQISPTFYVVQLMSLSNKENLEAYFSNHKLLGLSAARVESNEEVLFVLLLGIYENYANAQQASVNMPIELENITPWIRSLDSLQKAMVRADELTGTMDY